MEKQFSGKSLVIRIMIRLLFVSLIIGLAAAIYLENRAVKSVAETQAVKIAQMTFGLIFNEIKQGAKSKEIDQFLNELNHEIEGFKVDTFPSLKLTKEMVLPQNRIKETLSNDKALKEAMEGRTVVVRETKRILFYYPVRMKKACMRCHTVFALGDTGGVVRLSLDSSEIEAPIVKILRSFGLFFLVFILALVVAYYKGIDRELLTPLSDLTQRIKSAIGEDKLGVKLQVSSKISEIIELTNVFNSLISRIHYYYNKMFEQLYRDTATELPNFNALKRDLKRCISQNVSVVVFNINRFREINHYYGFSLGDAILRELARTLDDQLSDENSSVYRIGGDEFAWLCKTHVDYVQLLELLEELHAKPFNHDGGEIFITLTCGVAHGRERLIEHAEAALQYAKEKGRPFESYEEAMLSHEKMDENMLWTRRLVDAIENDRILIYFQPILDLDKWQADKFECLIRILDKDGKTVYSPIKFMDVAKISRHYLRLTRIVVDKAFTYFSDRPYHFSINLGMEDIADVPTRQYILNRLSDFPEPSRVTFEILESEAISDFEILDNFFESVRSKGAKIAIDDFGSGYSNYEYIIKLVPDFIKIDGSLIRRIDQDKEIEAVVRSIVQVADDLDIRTVAEYVHSQSVLEKVKELGIDYVQGYYIDAPVSDIEDYFSKVR